MFLRQSGLCFNIKQTISTQALRGQLQKIFAAAPATSYKYRLYFALKRAISGLFMLEILLLRNFAAAAALYVLHRQTVDLSTKNIYNYTQFFYSQEIKS